MVIFSIFNLIDLSLDEEFSLQSLETLGIHHSEILEFVKQEPLFDSFRHQNVDLIELRYQDSYLSQLGPIISKVEGHQFIIIVKRKNPDSNGHLLMGALRGISSCALWNIQERDYFQTKLGQYWLLFEDKFATSIK
jgi:hypothetical protein